MANFMEGARVWLSQTLTDHASVGVVYTRGRKSVTFNAVPGRPRVVGQTPGTAQRVRLDDERVEFHFQPALLDFADGNGAVEPAEGDRLTIGAIVREVAPDGTQPFTRRSDIEGNMIAVNTIKV